MPTAVKMRRRRPARRAVGAPASAVGGIHVAAAVSLLILATILAFILYRLNVRSDANEAEEPAVTAREIPTDSAKTPAKATAGPQSLKVTPMLPGKPEIAAPRPADVPRGFQVLKQIPRPQPATEGKLYSGRDIAGIESIVQAADEPWRKAAKARIDKLRKVNMELLVVDQAGHIVPNADVRVRLVKHQFRFGGVVNLRSMFRNGGTNAEMRRDVYLKMGFNAAGFENALKYKFKAVSEGALPAAFDWLNNHGIPARGHCLIWPGPKHYPKGLEKAVKSGNKASIRKFCAGMIEEAAKRWDVVEWDVINETRGNHAIQDLVGKDVIVDWFKIARKHCRNPRARLYLNENRIISDPKPGIRTRNIEKFRAEVKYLVDHGAPIDALGFQTRFGRMNNADEIYKRLCLFDEFGLSITATEFEIKPSIKNELDKAVMTDRAMTVYFSHRLVDGMFIWTLFPNDTEKELVDNSGKPNLRGKIWLYNCKKRWMTDERLRTDPAGTVALRGLKGEYVVEVRQGDTVSAFAMNAISDVKGLIRLNTWKQ